MDERPAALPVVELTNGLVLWVFWHGCWPRCACMLGDMTTLRRFDRASSDDDMLVPTIAPSVLPAIDEVIARFVGRGMLTATEAVDALLDLRLIAATSELVTG